jgi:hypothetical protein
MPETWVTISDERLAVIRSAVLAELETNVRRVARARVPMRLAACSRERKLSNA